MIKAETDPVLIQMVQEKDMGAIINWFEQRKESLYKLAWTYMKNTEDIQDVFYQVMLKIGALPVKQRKNPNFEKWFFLFFIEECKKRRVQEDLDDVLILTYILGFSQNEVAEILEISAQIVKERLYQGIQKLNSAEQAHYQELYIDYLSRELNRPEKIALEIHLHSCKSCQQSLANFQQTISSIIDEANVIVVPGDFLEPVITKLKTEEEAKRNKKKKRTTIGVGVASILFLLILIGYFTNAFAYMYYSWLDWQDKEDEQLLNFYKSGIGEPLNLVQESNGLKITIKSAIADDFQTLIYYEVENLEGKDQYGINFWDGVNFEDEFGTFDQHAYPINHLPIQPLESDGTVFKGKLGLLPVSSEAKTIKLNISRLQKIGNDSEDPVWMDYNSDVSFTPGNWSFEIPIKKQASIEYPVDEKLTVDGLPIEINKLIMAPTVTALQYSYEPNTVEKNINELFFKGIETKEKTAKPIGYGWNFPVQNNTNEYFSFQSLFDSLYFDDTKEARVHLHSLSYYMNDLFNVEFNMNQPFPQTFEYLGSEISINKVEPGLPTKIEVSAEMTEDRIFESIDFEILGQNNTSAMSMGISSMEGVLVDRHGKRYDPYEFNYYAIQDVDELPRHYQTEILIEIHNDASDEEFIPGSLQIRGYQSTTYVDEVITFELK